MKKFFLFFPVFFILSNIIFSEVNREDLKIVYLEGNLEVNDKGNWKEATLGDEIAPDSVIRLRKNTLAELSNAQTRLILSRDGVYSVEKLLKKERIFGIWKLAAIVKEHFRSLTGKGRKNEPGIMGVRGAEVGSSEEGVEWVDESAELLKEGVELVKAGKYREALEPLLEGLDAATDETEQDLFFYAGYCYFMLNDTANALKYINEVPPDREATYYEDYLLVRGQLLLESFSFKKALELFRMYIADFPEGEGLQSAYYMAALSAENLAGESSSVEDYSGLRNEYLKKAYEMNPSSVIGNLAGKLLTQLQ